MGEKGEGVILFFWRYLVYTWDILFVILDGFSCIYDGSVAVLKLGIVVEGFTNGLAFFDCGINAFKGFRETGFERGLTPAVSAARAASCLSLAASSWART